MHPNPVFYLTHIIIFSNIEVLRKSVDIKMFEIKCFTKKKFLHLPQIRSYRLAEIVKKMYPQNKKKNVSINLSKT